MSRNQMYKPGDLVRSNVEGNTLNRYKSGQVVEVVRMGGWGDSGNLGNYRYVMTRTIGDTSDAMQSLRLTAVKPAKQAMRKRDEYLNRRG